LIALLGAAVIALGAWTVHSARQPGTWQHVLATREGDIGGLTSSRTVIRADSMFVALPHPRALGRSVEMLVFDDDGHEIDKRENRAVLVRAMSDWLSAAFAPSRIS